jgi:uncharacterized membrane protein YhaH (DUF805 family)
MNLAHLFLGFDGRIGRARFWLGLVVLIVAEFLLDALIQALFPRVPDLQIAIADFVIGLVLLYPTAAVATKRLRDRAQSGTWVWLLCAADIVGMLVDLLVRAPNQEPSLGVWIVRIAVSIILLGFVIELGFRSSRVAPA